VCCVSEAAQVELKRGGVCAPAPAGMLSSSSPSSRSDALSDALDSAFFQGPADHAAPRQRLAIHPQYTPNTPPIQP